ncbi:Uma2 family endonuclease [Streptomyces sp. NPDC004009]
MTAVAHEPTTPAEGLLDIFLSLDTPEGFRAELIEGEIVVTPPPDGDHEKYISRIVRQVIKRSRVDMDFSGNKGLRLKSGGGCPRNHVIPDAAFGALHLDLFGGADSWMPCDGIAMVLEVTSSKPEADRETKRRCYARAGIPTYLLADRETGMLTLFSEPENEDYLRLVRRSFGDPLSLPEPFAFELDTTDLV